VIEDVEVLFDEYDPDPFESESFFLINLDNGDGFTVTSNMISEASPSDVIDRYGYGYEDEYFWFFYDFASMQAGRLMIFDANKRSLDFDYHDEGFCVTSMGYSSVKNSFLGVASYAPPMTSKVYPDRYFFIGKDRVLEWDPEIS